MAFLASFLQYLIIFIILVAIATLGVFLGHKWRVRSDAKNAAKLSDETKTDSQEGEVSDAIL